MTLPLPHDDVVPTDEEIAELGLKDATILAFRRAQENYEKLRQQWPLNSEALAKAPHVNVYASGAQSIAHSTWTPLSYDTVAYENGADMWAAGAPTRLTAPRPGLYLVGGDVILDWPGGEAYLSVWSGGARFSASFCPISSAGSSPHLNTSTTMRLAAGGYFELAVFQGSGVAKNTYFGGSFHTRAHMTFLSP